MSRAIEQVTISSEDDGRLVLGNAQAAAVMDIGNSWTTLRIGFRFTLEDIGGNILGGPRLCIGVMSAPTAGVGNGPLSGSSTGHYVGSYNAGVTSYARTAGPPCRYTETSGTAFNLGTKVGSTFTTIRTSPAYIASGDTTIRKAYIIQIVKAAGVNASSLRYYLPNGWTATDQSYTGLLQAMELTGTPSAADIGTALGDGGAGYATAVSSGTIDEAANGDLTSIVVAWDRTAPPIHISEVLFSKWS